MEEKDFIIEENGVYINEVGNLVQIKHIDKEKNNHHSSPSLLYSPSALPQSA